MLSGDERLAQEREEKHNLIKEFARMTEEHHERLVQIAAIVNAPLSDEQPDVAAFGRGAWVYCSQHMKPHQTGWCSVSVRDKIGLGVSTAEEAYTKCRDWKLPIYGEKL